MQILRSFILELLSTYFSPDGMICNFFGLEEKIQNLERKIALLGNREDDINKELKVASDSHLGRKRKRQVVQHWLGDVKRIRTEFQSLQRAAARSKFYSFGRLQLGKDVEELISEVGELIKQSDFPGGITLDVNTCGTPLLATGLVGQSSQNNLDKIWKCLRNDKVLRIGVYGMGGVGKTTSVMHIHNWILQNSDTFGNVYWITVSQNFSIRGLQEDIARKLSLNLSSEDDELTRASFLSEAFMRLNKSVLILDDVWNHIHLDRVGIPTGRTSLKLILTTRLFEVCSKMGCQSIIKLEPLSEEESWNLFEEKLGNAATLHVDILEIAKLLVKRCAGLPLGIITMAASLRGVNDIHQWRNLLEELKEPIVGQGDIESEVILVLRSSYNRLKNKILQLCFLYCLLFPEDMEIERNKLITYFIIEGVVDMNKTRKQQFDMGHTVLNELESCCVLESCISSLRRRCVKMHDLTRDMATQVTRESGIFMVKAGAQLTEIPGEHMWTTELEKVSLMKNKISEISAGTSPKCPRLQTLILEENPLKCIADSFFINMPCLQVLNLNFTWIKQLPNSVSELTNLTALLLRGCGQLVHVPSMKKLTALRHLDLGRTRLPEVPQGMDMLTSLQCLYMDHMKFLKMLPTGILPQLSNLRVFTTMRSPKRVTVQGDELMGLKHLEEFQGNLQDLCNYTTFINSDCYKRLHKCRVYVSYDVYPDEFENEKEFRFGNCSLKKGGGHELFLSPDIQYVVFSNYYDMSSCLLDLTSSFNNARVLQNLVVSHCDDIESIFKTPDTDNNQGYQLQNLEILRLHDLSNLKSLFCKTLPPFSTFFNLKLLHLSRCHKLKNLLTTQSLGHLQVLEDIRIWECNEMEEVIADEGGIGDCSLTLQRMKKLNLATLPKLKSICRGKVYLDSIVEMSIIDCQKLRRLPFCLPMVNGKTTHPPALEKIEIHPYEWWDLVSFDNIHAKDVLGPFVQPAWWESGS